MSKEICPECKTVYYFKNKNIIGMQCKKCDLEYIRNSQHPINWELKILYNNFLAQSNQLNELYCLLDDLKEKKKLKDD